MTVKCSCVGPLISIFSRSSLNALKLGSVSPGVVLIFMRRLACCMSAISSSLVTDEDPCLVVPGMVDTVLEVPECGMIDTTMLSSAVRLHDICVAYRVQRELDWGNENPVNISSSELFPED
jgi:hypothetical protein